MCALALTDPVAFAASLAPETALLAGLGFRVLGNTETCMQSLWDLYDTFVFDVDGVLLWGSSPLGQVGEALRLLRLKGKRLVFLTNTSAKTRMDCANGLRRAGIEAAEDEVSRASGTTEAAGEG